jgi:N-acetyl sugar amidotransferase
MTICTRDRARVRVEERVRQISVDGKSAPYDCIIGVSGGVDSTYVAWQVKQLGLRPLAVHLDNGWDSEIAVSNIRMVLDKVKVDLHTEVLDWPEFKDLQRSFLLASTPDAEVPSDHAIFACLYHTATKFGVKHVITGINTRTETHMPPAWSHGHFDYGYISAVQRQYGTRPLKSFPHYSFIQYATAFGHTHSTWHILNYLDYSKTRALAFLQQELGWRDYGGKHFESIYTRWYQGVYLPRKFGYDKRRSHLSSRICSGELTRAFALEELAKPSYDPVLQEQDHDYIAKKLGFSAAELAAIMAAPPRHFREFPSYERRLKQPWARALVALYRLSGPLTRRVAAQP